MSAFSNNGKLTVKSGKEETSNFSRFLKYIYIELSILLCLQALLGVSATEIDAKRP